MHHCAAREFGRQWGEHVKWNLKNARSVGVGREEQPWNSLSDT